MNNQGGSPPYRSLSPPHRTRSRTAPPKLNSPSNHSTVHRTPISNDPNCGLSTSRFFRIGNINSFPDNSSSSQSNDESQSGLDQPLIKSLLFPNLLLSTTSLSNKKSTTFSFAIQPIANKQPPPLDLDLISMLDNFCTPRFWDIEDIDNRQFLVSITSS